MPARNQAVGMQDEIQDRQPHHKSCQRGEGCHKLLMTMPFSGASLFLPASAEHLFLIREVLLPGPVKVPGLLVLRRIVHPLVIVPVKQPRKRCLTGFTIFK